MDGKPATRKRALTADEAELWAFAMRDAKGLKRRGRGKTAKLAANGESAAPDKPAVASAPNGGASPSPASAAPRHHQLPVPPQQPKSPALAVFDEKERRRLGRSPDLIDARLDLHGFRQREAHAALRAFLLSCSVRGHRHVLIITGKGAVADRQQDFFGEERGVLRRLVPQWLGDPELRGIVVSYTASHIRHGGEGALYVRLRKPGAR